ncbi:MAG: hypothetical protein HYX55_02720 [Chloroflexi bacterium]|nr:hypothetical protein [Chloroflexota bacterium]
MSGQRPFDPAELGTQHRDELDGAAIAAGRLDAAIDPATVAPSPDFTSRVMAALVDEPTPSSAGFLAPVRRRGFLTGFGASVQQAWRSVFSGRPVLVRATALAYVLVVVLVGTSLAGVATIGLAGALGKLGPAPTQSTSPQVPGQTAAPDRTERASGESEPPGVDESSDPSETPDASDDRGSSGGPDASDDHGGDTSSPGSSDSGSDDNVGTPRPSSTTSSGGSDDSGSGSGSGSSTPEPSDTPRPTGTPKPSETPN